MSKRTFSDFRSEQSSTPSSSRLIPSPKKAKTLPTLDHPDTSQPPRRSIPFQQPTQIISFSYTPSQKLEFTNSALRYFIDPPLGANLGYGYERWVRKPEQRGRIDGLLQAFSKARDGSASGSLQNVEVVAWRGVMTRILTFPYEEREGWDLNVMFANGVMYFEDHLSEARLKEKNDMEPRHRLQTYYGYAFESYCTSDNHARDTKSDEPVGWGGNVNTNVQWCSVVRTKLGNTRLLIGGEVDCVRGKYTGQTDTFVELKTSLAIRGPHDESKFEKYMNINLPQYNTLPMVFSQEIAEVLLPIISAWSTGFRTSSGIVTTTQIFKTIQIPRLVRGKPGAWDPLVCLDWGDQFLTFLKDAVQKERLHSEKGAPVWRVRFRPGAEVSIVMLDEDEIEDVVGGEDRVGFLPTWYWDEVHATNAHMGPQSQGVEDRHATTSDAPPPYAGWQI